MSHNEHESIQLVNQGCDLLWGYDEIGQLIGRTPRQVEHLRRSGALKSLKKVAGKWVGSRSALLRELGAA